MAHSIGSSQTINKVHSPIHKASQTINDKAAIEIVKIWNHRVALLDKIQSLLDAEETHNGEHTLYSAKAHHLKGYLIQLTYCPNLAKVKTVVMRIEQNLPPFDSLKHMKAVHVEARRLQLVDKCFYHMLRQKFDLKSKS